MSTQTQDQAQCNICGWQGTMLRAEMAREGMNCGNCGSTSRSRAVVYALGKILGLHAIPLFQWPPMKSVSILESSPRGPYPVMLSDKFNYLPTEYDEERIRSEKNPRAYADFQKLQFNDAQFDLVIASDVFEHIRNDAAAFREVFRVLKEGGSLLLTVPYDHDRAGTILRVDTSGPKDVHLLEPEYHGGGGHTLAYRNYGRDLLTLLHGAGFATLHSRLHLPGLGITDQSVFVARKGVSVEVIERDESVVRMPAVGTLIPNRLFLLLKYNLRGFVQNVRQVLQKIRT